MRAKFLFKSIKISVFQRFVDSIKTIEQTKSYSLFKNKEANKYTKFSQQQK